MDNAPLFFDSLRNYGDIKDLIGKQEDQFLDFKESRTRDGALLDDDEVHFSKAASGFAHQQGGVMVWGIKARKNKDGVDEAIALKPIPNIKRFLSELNGYVKRSTDPVVDGILSRIICETDDENSNMGFAVTFFPRSDSVHRAQWKNGWSGFYKRYGDSFVSLSTADIRDLFFRNLSPELELRVTSGRDGALRFSLYNKGRGIAKFASAHIGWIPNTGGTWFDGEGNDAFKVGAYVNIQQEPYSIQFIANPNVVVHPDQEISILTGPSSFGPQRPIVSKVFYRLFAENMVPKEGSVEF